MDVNVASLLEKNKKLTTLTLGVFFIHFREHNQESKRSKRNN